MAAELSPEERYEDLLRFARGLTRREDTARDLVQFALLQWYRQGHQLRDRARIHSWLCTTLRREFLRERQRASRWEVEGSEHALEEAQAEPASREALQSDEIAAVRHAVSTLPVPFRLTVELFYFQALSLRQVSVQLEVPVGTVLSRLYRARRTLRRHLGESWALRSPAPSARSALDA